MKMEYFSKGKRGKIYLEGKYAIKRSNPLIVNREVKWLKLLNKHNIGPRLISYNKNSFKYKFIKGDFIVNFIEKSNKTLIKSILFQVLKQCRIMDRLKINKKEMHKPLKHVIINKNKTYLIDFERGFISNKPKNVSQFCQFIISNRLKDLLKKKGFKINKSKILKKVISYKHNQNEKNFKEILKLVK